MIRAFIVLVLLGVSGEAFSSVDSSSAIAYLFDSEGEVFVVRSGVTNRVDSSCVTLCAQDRVALFADASARVIFPSSLYELTESGLYLIQRAEQVAVEADSGEVTTVLSMRGSRGAGNPLLRGGDEPDLVLPPPELFAYVKPPVFRQSNDADNIKMQGKALLSSITDKAITAVSEPVFLGKKEEWISFYLNKAEWLLGKDRLAEALDAWEAALKSN